MSLLDALRVALRAIFSSRLRSSLTTLGLVIGVSSVIVLIAVGQGTQKGVTDRIRRLGTDLIFVEPGVQQAAGGGAAGGAGSAQTLTTGDADAIADAFIPGVIGVSPQLNINAQAIAGTENLGVTIVGTTAGYVAVHDSELRSGSFLTPEQDTDLVVVLGSRVAETLFPGLDPVGQDLRLSFAGGRLTLGFLVIGVMEERGGSGGDADDQVFITTASLLSRIRFLRGATGGVDGTPVTQIAIQTAPGADEEQVKGAISDLLLFLHETSEPDFVIQSQDDLISAATEVSNTLSLLLGSIAGISLLVGGIGVMNIMLVSVTERTREIGIRRAVGARASDIVRQFVTEALTLSLFGGLVGVGLGVGIALAVSGREVGGQEMTTVIQPWSIIAAFAVAGGVGLISGSYPAYRATAVDPIAALRNE
jgi:putative ABC transport system permease protein